MIFKLLKLDREEELLIRLVIRRNLCHLFPDTCANVYAVCYQPCFAVCIIFFSSFCFEKMGDKVGERQKWRRIAAAAALSMAQSDDGFEGEAFINLIEIESGEERDSSYCNQNSCRQRIVSRI